MANMSQEDKRTEGLLTVQEAADYLGYAKGTVYQKVSKGEIPHVKLGRSVRFRRRDLDAWADLHAVPPQSGSPQP
jgi:excisionase family DNA binding protein